jgi:TRAP-type C4-dicarboxylate transport system substrate-binding protein
MKVLAKTMGMAALLGIAVGGGSSYGAELPRTHVKGVGEGINIINGSLLEQPFWDETIPQASGGMVTGDVIPFDQLGLDNAAVLRLLKLGGMDFGTTDFSRLAADDPHFEGCDLAGISLTVDEVRAACDAYRPVLDRLLQENWNSKLLFLSVAQPQVFWCRMPISGLADLEGKKVRVFNKTMVDFLDGVGAAAVSMVFPEVFAALQRGVVDCAVTGALSGNTSGWGEVTTHQYPMSLGWAVRFTAVNLDSWERFDPAVRDFFVEQFAKQEDKAWALMKEATADAESCNTGQPSCKYGKKADLTIVPISAEDQAKYKQIVEQNVLRGWAERCGAECANEWNETVGKTVGLTATVD